MSSILVGESPTVSRASVLGREVYNLRASFPSSHRGPTFKREGYLLLSTPGKRRLRPGRPGAVALWNHSHGPHGTTTVVLDLAVTRAL
jgi:hypothetical protein